MASNPLDVDFDAVVRTTLKGWHIPGLSVSVVHNEHTWSKGYGVAQHSPEKNTEPNTLFYAASTTKAQLCAAWTIFMRSDANKGKPESDQIKWSTPLADIIREDFVLEDPVTTSQITLEDAVSHRTGMPRHELCYGKEGPSNVKDVTRHLRHLPLHETLRTNFEYCNTMYMAATHALETATGKHLSDILREWLWEPLGMKDTYLGYGEATKATTERGATLAKAYYWTKLPGSPDYDDGELKEQPYMDFPEVSGAGEVISTADDYAKWMRCLISSSSPLSSEMTEDLWTARSIVTAEDNDHVPFDGGLLNYGLGWFVSSYKGYKCLWHPGGITGAGSLIMIVPKLNWGCSFFGNGNDVSVTARGIIFELLDKVIGVRDGTGRESVAKATVKQFQEIGTAWEEGRKKLYPDAPPKPTIPLTLAIEDYAGTYTSTPYGRLTFIITTKAQCVRECSNLPTPAPDDADTKVLTFLTDNKTWVSRLTLEHVNAEYWLGRRELGDSPIHRSFRAESKVGADGKVTEIGLAMEDSMPDRLFWFRKEKKEDAK